MKIVVICGPTATGKTALGLLLTEVFNGELVSADSRQVYKGMDIGTGKDLPKDASLQLSALECFGQKLGFYRFSDTKVWGLDLVEPNKEFSVAHFVKFASVVIKDIWQRGKLPIIVGGSGFWIKSLFEKVDSLGIPPDWELREKLDKQSIEQLSEKLKELDYKRWQKMNQSDKVNPRRLIRAIEIKVQSSRYKHKKNDQLFNFNDLLIIGLRTRDLKSLYQRIDKRVEERIKLGAEKEIKMLLRKGYSWKLPSFSATGYRLWQDYFEGKKNLKEIIQCWQYDEHNLARQQLTFFRKMKKIKWFEVNKAGWEQQIEKKVSEWYSRN